FAICNLRLADKIANRKSEVANDMIQLICTHCRAMLEMDDGFAGGACRCRHCGTIQTVPSSLKNKGGARPSRTLYQTRSESAVPSSGLDQLADVVASSGLNSARLRRAATPAEIQAKPPENRNVKPLLIGAGALIVILCGALIYLVTRNSSQGAAPAPHPDASAAVLPVHPPANFCGVPLNGETVIYLLDRGDSTRDHFDALKSATIKSLQSLGEKKQFQILFWNNGGKDAGYPKNWPIYATAD